MDAGPRQCQPCTACCDGWLTTRVNDEAVGPGSPCRHSRPGGCAIYADRPENPCRAFFCGWIREDSPLPDWMRPSECGAIVFVWFEWHGRQVINAVPVGARIPPRTLEWLKAYAQEQGRPLIFSERIEQDGSYVGLRGHGFGPPDFRREVEKLKLAREQLALIDMAASLKG